MKTGEGKTLVATLPCYLNALGGKGVHVVTVNDYLAKRDSEWMGRIYKFPRACSVGVIVHDLDDQRAQGSLRRRHHLRHQQRVRLRLPARQHEVPHRGLRPARPFNYAIVDEVDSILIDEARTPLIISGPSEESTDKYYKINRIIPKLHARRGNRRQGAGRKVHHRRLHHRRKAPRRGPHRRRHRSRSKSCSGMPDLFEAANLEWTIHHVEQALRAHVLYQRDNDYVVKDGDERAGSQIYRRRVHRPPDARPPLVRRPAPGRRSQGKRQDPAREPDPRHHHLPELLPHVQEARRHDRHGGNRSRRVSEDLQPRRHGGSHQPCR